MALVHEETKHEYLGAEVMVSQRQRGECIEDWDLCHLEVDSMRRRTPDELVELGEWLITQGKRIKSTYRKNGAPDFRKALQKLLSSDAPCDCQSPDWCKVHAKCARGVGGTDGR